MPDPVREYRFVPLGPVHIGSGETLAPEDYVLQGDRLVCFNPHALLHALNPEGKARYEQALDAGRMKDALEFLRNFFLHTAAQAPNGRSRFERFRTVLGRGSAREIGHTVEEPERRHGEIHALLRNPYTGAVVIPGSSIKGAIRTAVLSANVNPGGQPDPNVKARLGNARSGEKLEELGFDYDHRRTEEDPFRLVAVADTEWPADAVRVDRAALSKLGRDAGQTQGMQMHYERLVSRADNPARLPDCRIRIRINEEPLRYSRVRESLRRPATWDYLVQACSYFYWNRLQKEEERFSELLPEPRRWKPDYTPGTILLRVGRHCHFDSLSVDHFRQGWNAARHEPIYEIGSTRTLCDLNGGGQAPFGWLLLEPVG